MTTVTPFFQEPPLPSRHKLKAPYDSSSWFKTILSLARHTYVSMTVALVAGTCILLVVISYLPIFRVPESERECRAWCSRIAIGSQAHQYVGVILFLIMAFRNNAAFSNFKDGLSAFHLMRTSVRSLVNNVLFRIPQESITIPARTRAIGLAVSFPYATILDLRDKDAFDPDSVDGLISNSDIWKIQKALSPPLAAAELLSSHITTEIQPHIPAFVAKSIHNSVFGLLKSLDECEKLKENPYVLSYIVHLRFLVVVYVITLPLVIVEQIGWTSIPVMIILSYALMSIEMLAADIEYPFEYGKSDIRVREQCLVIKDQAQESWQRWNAELIEMIPESNKNKPN